MSNSIEQRDGAVEVADHPLAADRFSPPMRALRQALDDKLPPMDELLAELQRRRAAGGTVVFSNGCFDVLHLGHVSSIQHCRQFGDTVVIGLNSDASVRRQNKGPDRPIWEQTTRALMLASLECVDFVVLFDDETPIGLLERLRPDVLVKGSDWAADVKGRELVESYGGRIELAPLLDQQNTTMLIDHIRSKGPGH